MMRLNIFTLNTLRGHFNFASLAVLACVAILSLSSCNVEEFPHPVGPEQPKMVNFRLNLEYITEMPIYKDITITRDGGYDLRYQINAYRMKEDGYLQRNGADDIPLVPPAPEPEEAPAEEAPAEEAPKKKTAAKKSVKKKEA